MKLDDMCMEAARLSDRYDEFEKTENDDGDLEYQDDALHYFNVFRDGINEAYYAVSRERFSPEIISQVTVNDDGVIDLTTLNPAVYSVRNLFDSTLSNVVKFDFQTKFSLKPIGDHNGDTLMLKYHYMPEKLEDLDDEPVFPESVVDPMVYISLAVARMWLSEKKITLYQQWMSEYYTHLSKVKSNLRGSVLKRVPRGIFR